jgi:hypothetical protein
MIVRKVQTNYDVGRFSALYVQSVEDIFEFWTPKMQEEIAQHCYPWRFSAFDFKNYLLASNDAT